MYKLLKIAIAKYFKKHQESFKYWNTDIVIKKTNNDSNLKNVLSGRRYISLHDLQP